MEEAKAHKGLKSQQRRRRRIRRIIRTVKKITLNSALILVNFYNIVTVKISKRKILNINWESNSELLTFQTSMQSTILVGFKYQEKFKYLSIAVTTLPRCKSLFL